MEGGKHPAQGSAGLPLGSVQHIELGDDVPFLRGQAAHQVLQPDGCRCFFLRGWASRGELLVCLQQPLIGILPAGGKGGGLCLLVTGELLCFQVVGEVFLFPGMAFYSFVSSQFPNSKDRKKPSRIFRILDGFFCLYHVLALM